MNELYSGGDEAPSQNSLPCPHTARQCFLRSRRPSPCTPRPDPGGLHSPSSGQGPSSRLSLESEARCSLAGGDRELSTHLAASVWKPPTGVVPPDDSPPRDLSSSLWASSTSWKSCRGTSALKPLCS